MTEVGKEVRRRLELVPAKAVIVEDWYYTYACRKCENVNTETAMVKDYREPNFIPVSFAIPKAAAHLIVQKFVMSPPLYRQEQELKRHGIPLSRQTMSNWLLWSAEHLLAQVYDLLHQELLKRDVLHADETTLQVLHEPGKTAQSNSYMRLYRTSGYTETGPSCCMTTSRDGAPAIRRKERPGTALRPKGWLTATSCSKFRKLWQTFLQKKKSSMTSVQNRQNLFWTLCWRGQIPEPPRQNPPWARHCPTSRTNGPIYSINSKTAGWS